MTAPTDASEALAMHGALGRLGARLLLPMSLVWLGCRADPGALEARALLRAYGDFQAASPVDRPAALDALARRPCQAHCAARDACVTYAGLLARAQHLVRKARELGPADAGGNGAATSAELALIVSSADDAAQAAQTAEPACREALGALRESARER